MIIYCDRINFHTVIFAVRKTINTKKVQPDGTSTVYVLDRLSFSFIEKVYCSFLDFLGCKVIEAVFDDGSLRLADGRAAGIAARDMNGAAAYRAAEVFFSKHKIFQEENVRYGNNLILHAAKVFYPITFDALRRLVVADCLARLNKEKSFCFIQANPLIAHHALLCEGIAIDFDTYSPCFMGVKSYFLNWFKLGWEYFKLIRGRSNKVILQGDKKDLPALLVLQEDDLSLDRSIRSQPHWLFPQDPPLTFNIIALKTGKHLDHFDLNALNDKNIFLMDLNFVFSDDKEDGGIKGRLNSSYFSFIAAMVFSWGAKAQAAFYMARLLFYSRILVGFCRHYHVKAFMTCENYLPLADAMALISKDMQIETLSYQYSNIRHTATTLLTRSDKMMTFSSLYFQYWDYQGVKPKEFISTGYLYDGSFALLKDKALQIRKGLEDKGVKFIICYFDETISPSDKYGVITAKNYEEEFLALIKFVQGDPTLGLVVKAQFQFNLPGKFARLREAIGILREEGRYIELTYGKHRNAIFPAQAAMCADIAIGNPLGGTASLEAALVGTRSIFVNNYGVRTSADKIYAQADIVYPGIDEAITAIKDFRAGDSARAALGDWSAIIDDFDSFRDGKAHARMRKVVESSITGA